MSTYKRTGPDGLDYALPSKRPLPPPPPRKPVPPPPPFEPIPCGWGEYAEYPETVEPVECPPIPGRRPLPPPPPPFPPYPPCPPCPPYPMPKPEKIDESSKKLAKLSQNAKVLVQMIKDFEQKNKPAILTVGNHSYQFGTENILDFSGEPAKGMYSKILCGDPIQELNPEDYDVDDTNTRVYLKDPKDLLQSELARIRQEITLVAAALNEEVQETNEETPKIPGVND